VARLTIRLLIETGAYSLPEDVDRFATLEAGSEDRTLLGVPVRLIRAVRQLFTLEQHRIVVHMPESGLPLALREGLTNVAEARAATELALTAPEREYVVTSLFAAQCRTIAAMAAEANLHNVRVILPDRLGQRTYSRPPNLILSLAVPTAAMGAGWPLSDLEQIGPMLIGDWTHITIVVRLRPRVWKLAGSFHAHGYCASARS
jgi:hypothetical protein